MSDEIQHETSDRGFKHYPLIRTSYGHLLRVYESSAAFEPHLWLAVDAKDTSNGDDGEMHVHLAEQEARELRDLLDWALEHHYQREGDSA